ncbi:MAG: translation elongation factor Ts [Gemmatimonadales bacterium]|nr:translation elongation factor Ts [Gemmatimonadales bacterium]
MAGITISTKDISELRARTGAGIGDCKKALEEAGGDLAKAAELLRAKGIAKAEKRAGRVASQGLVGIELLPGAVGAAMLELNSETDFVARNDEFKALLKALVADAVRHAPLGAAELSGDGGYLGQPFGDSTVGETVKTASGKTGEAIALRRVARFAPVGGVVGTYLHHNEQVGVLVELAGATGEAAVTLAREVALHVASADPIAVSPADIAPEVLERERRIAEEQVAAEGKPEAIRAKIVEGKLRKFAQERALLEQPFVKDESRTVGQMVAALPGASVVRFARFKVGEA